MAAIKKIPVIRFKGFKEEWGQDKLVNVCNTFTDGDWIESKDQSPNGIRLLQTGNIGINEYLDKPNNSKWINEYTFDKLNCKEVFEGDILISRLPEPAGRACIVPNLNIKMITAVDCTIIRTSDKCESKYLIQFLSSEPYFKEVINFLAGGTRQRISRSNLSKFIVPLPKINEQTQIGNYFKELDGLIQLQEQKLEKASSLKKAMLEKMFPKQNADVPEIRFKGFMEKWEKKKLGEVADFNPKSELPSQFEYVDLESVIGTEMINHRTEQKKTAPSRAQRLAKRNDLFYQTVRPYQKNNYLFELPFKDYVFSTGYAQLRPKIDSQLLLNIVQKNSFIEDVLNRCTGTSYPAISSSDLALIEVVIPSNKKEQQKIGEYFQNLDQLINQSQQKITQLKHLKQALLRKMFI